MSNTEATAGVGIVDMHCHALGNGTDWGKAKAGEDLYFVSKDNYHLGVEVLYNSLINYLRRMGAEKGPDGKISTDEYFDLVYEFLASSKELDGLVLLALDAFYEEDTGEANEVKTDLWVPNRFLEKKVAELNARLQAESDPDRQKKRFYIGASVSPNGPDAIEELERVIHDTDAVLIKWIPSVMNISIDNVPKHRAFYDILAKEGMPLLCHVGPEGSFPEGLRQPEKDEWRLLKSPLACGVTVIAPHCATPVVATGPWGEADEFLKLMEWYNRDGETKLWADTSALSLMFRLRMIKQIVKEFPPEYLLHGSDFPIFDHYWAHLPMVTHDVDPSEYKKICKCENPLDRDILIKRAHNFDERILSNCSKVLRFKT